MKKLMVYALIQALLSTFFITTTNCTKPNKDTTSIFAAGQQALQNQWNSLTTSCSDLWQNHKQAVIISAAAALSCGGALGCYYYQTQQPQSYTDQIVAWWDANPTAKLFAFLGGLLVVAHMLPDEDAEKTTPEHKEAQQQ